MKEVSRSIQGRGTWDEAASVRQTLLARLAPEEAEALDRLGRMVFAHSLAHQGEGGTGTVAEQLRAAAGDLRHTAGFLGAIAAQRETDEIAPYEARLCALAAAWQARIETILAEIETRLGRDAARAARPAPPRGAAGAWQSGE